MNEQLYPGTSLHVVCGTALLGGSIDFRVLHQAIARYVEETSAFHTVLEAAAALPMQRFVPEVRAEVSLLDLSAEADGLGALRALGAARTRIPFQMDGPLYEVAAVKLSEGQAGVFIRVHHLIGDAYALYLFLQGVARHYRSFLERGEPALGVGSDYADVLALEGRYFDSDRYRSDGEYWRARLSKLEGGTLLAGEDLGATRTDGRRMSCSWQADRVQGLLAATTGAGTRPYGAVVGLVGSVLARSLAVPRVCLGTPFINRLGAAAMRTFGMCVNTLPVVLEAAPDATLRELVRASSAEVGRALRHGRFPFQRARQQVPGFAAGQAPFDVGVSYQNTDYTEDLGFVVSALDWHFSGHEMNALTVHVHDRLAEGRVDFDLDYRSDLLTETQVRGLFDAVGAAADEVVSDTRGPWATRPLTATRVLRGKPTRPLSGTPASIAELFDSRARAHPEAVALREGTQRLTYAELRSAALACAERLSERGVRPGSLVPLHCPRAIETAAGMLGVLYAGAAYVPVVPGTTSARLQQILEATSAGFVLGGVAAPTKDSEPIRLHPPRARQGAPLGAPADAPVYVLFTSGSTGEPKKVVVDDGSLRHYLAFAVDAYADGAPCDMPLFTSVGFDLTVTSLYLPWLTGGTLHVYPDVLDDQGRTLRELFAEDCCDVVKLTPSHLRLLEELPSASRRLRLLVIGGEQLSRDRLVKAHTRLGPRVRLVNEYGPTEAVVGCTFHEWSAREPLARGGQVPIGLPVQGARVRLQTGFGGPQLPGFAGELEVGGPGLARGYLDDPALTAARFREDAEGRWYRTGDLVLERDGVLHCLGRNDRQVKVLGHRIELGELEAALRSAPGVADAYAVHVRAEDRLILFYIGHAQSALALRQQLSGRLPGYAQPADILHCEAFPLTPHGKVSEPALLELWEQRRSAALPDPSAGNIMPLSAAAAAVLELTAGVVSAKASAVQGFTFAAAGGDSVSAIHVVSRLRQLGHPVTVRDLLGAPSLRAFAERAVREGMAEAPEASGPETGVLDPPLAAQAWFLERAFSKPGHYHQSVLLEVEGGLELEAARAALHDVVRTHGALRLNLAPERRQLFFEPRHLEVPPPFADLAAPDDDGLPQIVEEAALQLKQSLDLNRDPLLRGARFRTPSGRTLLFLCAHHLSVDVASWFTLLQDFFSAYRAHVQGMPPTLMTSVQVRTVVAAQRTAASQSVSAAYWERAAAQVVSAALPPAQQSPDGPSSEASVTLADAFVDGLHVAYATRPEEFVLAVLLGTAARVLGRTGLVVEQEGHGRTFPGAAVDLSRAVGWLTVSYPVVFEALPLSAPELLVRAKDGLRSVPDEGLGWSRLRRAPYVPALKLNFLGRAMELHEPGISLSKLATGPDRAEDAPPEPLEVIVTRSGDDAVLRLLFHHGYFSAAARASFVVELQRLHASLIEHCRGQRGRTFTRSDFDTVALDADDLSALFDE